MIITVLFATAGATNAGLYPALGLCDQLARIGQMPPVMSHRVGGKASVGLLVAEALSLILAIGFDLTVIASIGSAVALLVFMMAAIAHPQVRADTGASLTLLVLAVLTCGIALLAFLISTVVNDPGSAIAVLVIILIGVIIDLSWKRVPATATATRADGRQRRDRPAAGGRRSSPTRGEDRPSTPPQAEAPSARSSGR
jgi:L-asparagine transporter-like permease